MTDTELHYQILPDGTAALKGGGAGRKRIVIPESVSGMTVSAIASHAFADRGEITEITVPPAVREIGSYAFYHCESLRKLYLTDSIETYADGVIRMCPSLARIEIRMDRGNWRLIKDLTGDSEAELDLCLRMPDGTAELLFPGYYNEIREDTRARAIHQSIVGAGYTYRQCVTRKGIDYGQYDAAFPRIAQVDLLTGGRIALGRLYSPYFLSEKAEAAYREFLPQASCELLPWLISERDAEKIRFLVREADVPREVLEDGAGRASDARLTEICGILMDAAGQRDHDGGMETFSLEDF